MTAPRILFIADEFLHPKHTGNRVETANEIALLTQVLGSDVHLFMPRDPWTTPALEEAHRTAVPVPTTFYDRPHRRRAVMQRATLPYVAATRFPIGRERRRMLAAAREAGPFDLIIAAHDFSWPFADDLSRTLGGTPIIVRSHNDEARYFDGQRAAARQPTLRLFYRREAALSRRLRTRLGRHAACVAVISAADAPAYDTPRRSATVQMLPPLMHTGALTDEVPEVSLTGRDQLLFVGALDHALSADGLEWFRLEALPLLAQRLPGIRLRVIGRGAPAPLARRLAADPRVDDVGEVDDLRPEYARARVFVNPVLGGSGINIKMGDPARLGIPIVTNELGARGFDGIRPGLSLADSAAEFAAQCELLLVDDTRWQAQATALATGFREHFSLQAAAAAYASLIDEVRRGSSVTPSRP